MVPEPEAAGVGPVHSAAVVAAVPGRVPARGRQGLGICDAEAKREGLASDLVDDAAGLVELRYAVTDEQFASIAKLRAARRLWARVLELSGATSGALRRSSW